MKRSFHPAPTLVTAIGLALFLAFATTSVFAQVQDKSGNFKYKADKMTLRPNGVRLDGSASIVSPQLEVRASAIAFDYDGNQITAVRARGKVNLKVNLTPEDGGAPVRIETNSDEADLDPPSRVLTLRGNVDGFYQPQGSVKTTLGGTVVVMRYVGKNIGVDITGPVTIIVPPEQASTSSAAIGTVKITSKDAKLDQKTGHVRFIGDARAVSTDGPNKFDVSAPEFILTRSDANTIDTLQTKGRTSVKIDLPSEPVKPAAAPATKPDDAKAAKPDAKQGGANNISKPTRVEVEADSAIVERATNTLTFEGNVTGFYFLSPAGSAPQKYEFSGNKAVLHFVPEAKGTKESPAGLKADITGTPGKPVEVETPSFNFDFGG